MLQRSLWGAGAAMLCLTASLGAQTPSSKVGVISVQGAIVGTKDGQKASQELDTKFQPRNKDFETRQTEITSLQDQLSKGGSVMSEDKRSQMTRDIDEKKKRLERDVQDARDELQTEQQRLLSSLGQRMMAVIEKYAKENGYSMILDVSNPNTPVLYASNTIDITQDIVSLYDKSPAPAGGTATPTTARPATPGTPRATPSAPGAKPGASN